MRKSKLQQIIKEEFNSVMNEMAAASSLETGISLKLSGNMGKFKTGSEVKVVSKKAFGNDIELTLSDGTNTDTFYIDRNDTEDIGDIVTKTKEAE